MHDWRVGLEMEHAADALKHHNTLVAEQNEILERIAHAMEFHWGIIKR